MQLSVWADILSSLASQQSGDNAELTAALKLAFPDVDFGSLGGCATALHQSWQLRGAAAHHSPKNPMMRFETTPGNSGRLRWVPRLRQASYQGSARPWEQALLEQALETDGQQASTSVIGLPRAGDGPFPHHPMQ